MYLEGLTPLQVEIAEVLWSLGTSHECQLWLSTLPQYMRDEALVVMQLMLLAAVDEEVESMEYYPDAEAIIDKIRKDR